jgi:hypothetical protein
MDAYRSDDLQHWEFTGKLLTAPGNRADDGWYGHHADVLVQGERAFIFYFTHPERHHPAEPNPREVEPYSHRRTSLQVAPLDVAGDLLLCDRDTPFNFDLQAGDY